MVAVTRKGEVARAWTSEGAVWVLEARESTVN